VIGATADGETSPKPASAGDWRPVAQLKPDDGLARARRFAAAWAWLIRAKNEGRGGQDGIELPGSALGTLTHARVAVRVRK